MSSTGLIDFNANYINSDIIDVNQKLTVNNIDIFDLINNNLNDISGNINDVSGNINNHINDISGNINDLWDKVNDLSNNVTQLKGSDTTQNSTISELQTLTGEQTTQIEANTGAITTLTGQTEANTTAIATGAELISAHTTLLGTHTTAIGGLVASVGIPFPATGLFAAVDSKLNRSAFGSGNIGIFNVVFGEYINLVYDNTQFEDVSVLGVNNRVFNLKEPYKSLPTSKNNYFTCETPLIKNDTTNTISIDLSGYHTKDYIDVSLNNVYSYIDTSLNNVYSYFDSSFNNLQNNKQDNLLFTSPLLKDVSNNVTIDLSSYVLNTKFDLSYNNLQNNKQENLLFTSPLSKDVSNNVTIDLSSYVIKTNFDSSFNNLQNNKQDNLSFTSPLLKDTSNNITIDLSSYVLKTNFDSSFNNLQNTKQDNLSFTSPLIKNDSNNITIDLGAYALKNALNASNVTSGTLPVSFGGTGSTVLNSNQILIGNGTNPILQSPNLIWDNATNTLSSNIINATSNLQEANINLSSKYLQLSGGILNNNLIINNGYIKAEQQYPPRLFDSFTPETTTTFLSKTVYTQTLTYNTIGDYILYSSSSSGSNLTSKDGLFNFASNSVNGTWTGNQYNLFTGIYSQSDFIDSSSNYKGDWIIIKLPYQINLTKFRFYSRPSFESRSPGEWKCYGSNDGITFSEIYEGHNLSRLSTSNYSSGYYETILSNTFTKFYNYIGFTINKLAGMDHLLNFNQIQLFGKEQVVNTAGLGIGTTQLFNARTSFQVNNRRLWIDSTPNSSISVLSTDKYGTGTTETYLQIIENIGMDCRTHTDGEFQFRCATQQAMTLNKTGASVKNLYVQGELIAPNLFGANATSKTLIKFQTKLGQNGIYYYNIDLDKYYKTGQTINGKDYKVFNLTSWSEDGFSIINKCTVYTSSEGSGIKYIMFYDNWGAYLSNGNQSGWQRDNSIRYMTFMTSSSKNIITILENLL